MKTLALSIFILFFVGCGNQDKTKKNSGIRSLKISSGISRIVYKINDHGEITFTVIYQEEERPVIEEYSGKFKISEDKIFYESASMKTEVGRSENEDISICTGDYSEICDISFSAKFPNSKEEGDVPIFTIKIDLKEKETTRGERYTELLSFVLPAPNQEDGGTCLFMSNTGAVEVLLNKAAGQGNFASQSITDLSERFLINASQKYNFNDWKTDTIYTFNKERGGLLNRDYPYTKGWYKKNGENVVKARPREEGASFGTQYNWINEYTNDLKSKLIRLPEIKRSLLFVDPEHNQWNTGIMSNDVVDKIKTKLKETRSPVLVMYNHFGYWHATLIVGYDDDKVIDANDPCPFVKKFIAEMSKENSPSQEYADKVKEAMKNDGGCLKKGIFYVRDSIYDGSGSEAIYDYSAVASNDEAPYSKKIITHSYNWIKYLGNHAYNIYSTESPVVENKIIFQETSENLSFTLLDEKNAETFYSKMQTQEKRIGNELIKTLENIGEPNHQKLTFSCYFNVDTKKTKCTLNLEKRNSGRMAYKYHPAKNNSQVYIVRNDTDYSAAVKPILEMFRGETVYSVEETTDPQVGWPIAAGREFKIPSDENVDAPMTLVCRTNGQDKSFCKFVINKAL